MNSNRELPVSASFEVHFGDGSAVKYTIPDPHVAGVAVRENSSPVDFDPYNYRHVLPPSRDYDITFDMENVRKYQVEYIKPPEKEEPSN